MKQKRILTNPCIGILTASALVLSTSSLQAALLASFVETFSGGGGGSANTSVYTLTSSTAFSSFTLENGVADGSFFDATSDGYATLRRTATANASNVIRGAYGTISLTDVGKVVSIDAGFRHAVGFSAIWSIQLDSANIGTTNDQNFLNVSSFTGHDITASTNVKLSEVPSINADTLRTPGALTYTIQAGDVGKALGLQVSVYENSPSAGTRTLFIDSISYSVIPEPSSALLGGIGMLALLRRRR